MWLTRFTTPLASIVVFLGALTIMCAIPSHLSAQPVRDEFGTLPILSASSASVAGRVPAMATPGPECSTAEAPAIAGSRGAFTGPLSASSLDCPEGVWKHHHDEDDADNEDYGDGVGVTWCFLTREYEVTFGIWVTVTVTMCEYSGCDLELEEAEAHMGGIN